MKSLARLVTALALVAPLSSCALFRTRPPSYPPVVTASGLLIQDLVVPEAEAVLPGARVLVHYEGRLLSTGEVFDSSYAEGQPVWLELGDPDLPAGLAEGLTGMPIGGRRELTLPPELGYGAEGIPDRVPPNESLLFTVEVLEAILPESAAEPAHGTPAPAP